MAFLALMMVAFIVLVILLIVVVTRESHPRARYPRQSRYASQHRPNRRSIHQQPQRTTSGRFAQIERQIMLACHGDESTKTRLITFTKGKFPDKDEKWVLEKVLFDLQRDNR